MKQKLEKEMKEKETKELQEAWEEERKKSLEDLKSKEQQFKELLEKFNKKYDEFKSNPDAENTKKFIDYLKTINFTLNKDKFNFAKDYHDLQKKFPEYSNNIKLAFANIKLYVITQSSSRL